jgi:hypothetical protein
VTLAFPLFAQAVAQAASGASTFDRIVGSMPWYGWVAIAAIAFSSLAEICKGACRHSERMALIRMGFHPDAPPEAREPVDGKPSYPEAAEL